MRDNVVGSGAKKAGRGMLIGMKENADEKGVEGEGECRVRRAWLLPASSLFESSVGVGLGSTLVEGWSSRAIDAGSSAAGVEVANLSSTVSTSTSVEIERGYRVQFAV